MRKWLALVVPVVLLVTAGARMVAKGMTNLAYLEISPHLVRVLPAFELPECQDRADVLAVQTLLEPGNSTLASGWVAWLGGDCAEAKVLWAEACSGSFSHQEALACLWLLLSTQGEMGGLPQESLWPELLATYSYRFGTWAARAEAQNKARFAYDLSLGLFGDHSIGSALYWRVQSQVAVLEQDWEQAALAYGRIGRLSSSSYRVWWEQARIYQRMQDEERAVQAFGRALTVRPNSQLPYQMVGRTYFQMERSRQAVGWLEKALQLAPEDVQSNYYMAQLLHRWSGQEDRALVFLAQAIDSNSQRPWHWAVQLGDWRLALGDREGALEAYRQALDWQPGEASIEERIEQMTKN